MGLMRTWTQVRGPCSTHDVPQEKKIGFSPANLGQRRARLLPHYSFPMTHTKIQERMKVFKAKRKCPQEEEGGLCAFLSVDLPGRSVQNSIEALSPPAGWPSRKFLGNELLWGKKGHWRAWGKKENSGQRGTPTQKEIKVGEQKEPGLRTCLHVSHKLWCYQPPGSRKNAQSGTSWIVVWATDITTPNV